jgi:catechol 2,3-dioxygenase-like lactoylglutathione lyase family enzyme
MQGFLHHIDLTVTDVANARPLYDLFLTHAGFASKGFGADWAGWGLAGRRYPCVTLNQARGENATRRHDRYSAGLHHLALAARDRGDVDALHAKLVAAGATILDPPAEYPEYGAGYYAVFFADADGLKLEYAWTPEPQEAIRAP